MSHRLAVVLGLSALIVALPLSAAEIDNPAGPKQPFEQSSTHSIKFAPGGTIRVDSSYGHLTVEGWDEPDVQITLLKSTKSFYDPSRQREIAQRFEKIQVAIEKRSDKELAITTTLASRHSAWSPPLPKQTDLGIILEYRILTPRDTHLVVKHNYGYIWVSDLTGDVEVKSHTGDMIVAVPDPGAYSIDARTHLGSVTSDLFARTRNQFLFGTHYVYADNGPSHRISLRMDRGSITILKGTPFAPFYKD
jgi:hypothetical protein